MAFPQTTAQAGISRLRSSVVAAKLGDENVLCDLRTGTRYRLNRTAWAIVRLIQRNAASREAVLMRCRQWGYVPFEREEICRFLADLESFGLVEHGAPGKFPQVDLPLRWSTPVIELLP